MTARMVLRVMDGQIENVDGVRKEGGDVCTVYERLSHFGDWLFGCL